MNRPRRGASLAGRLVLMFALGSGLVMLAMGYVLYHALGMQHQANEAANIADKARAVDDILARVDDRGTLEAALPRLKDLALGHRNLHIGVALGGRWLLEPGDAALGAAAPSASGHEHGLHLPSARRGRTWVTEQVRRPLHDGSEVRVIVALDTTESEDLLRSHALLAALVAALGTALSALVAWAVVRRGLAPLGHLAERAGEVTAQRLGARLDLDEAPHELHGLADSINRMLERLEESFRALEQFSADIAHELRTPLNNLLLQTQVTLSRERSTVEYRETLHSNLEELERLQRMVSEMLFLARADRGMIELQAEDVDLHAECESVNEYFEAAAAEKGQALALSGGARARCDRSLARRAITNLVSNAVRYAPDAARIVVALSADASWATVAVTNPGTLIAQPELERLFARFTRRDESRARGVEGTGLGLAIVDSIMKLQGGRVDAWSGAEGITFALRFPLPAGDISKR